LFIDEMLALLLEVLPPAGGHPNRFRLAIDAEGHAERRRKRRLGQRSGKLLRAILFAVTPFHFEFVQFDRRKLPILVTVYRTRLLALSTGSQHADQIAITHRALVKLLLGAFGWPEQV